MELYYLITISDRDRAEMLSAIYHAAGTGMVLTKLGRGTATGEQLSSYGLDAKERRSSAPWQMRNRPGRFSGRRSGSSLSTSPETA